MKGFSIIPIGKKKLHLKRVKETYDFSLPESTMYNLVIGETYIWHLGKMVIENLTNGVTAEIIFPEKGWSSKNDYKVYGNIKDNK